LQGGSTYYFNGGTWTNEEVGMANLASLELVLQGCFDVLLLHHLAKGGRAVFAVQDPIHRKPV
jgi:hypothetical protein